MYSNDLFNRLNGSGKQMTLVIAIGKVCAGAVAVVFMKFIGRKVNLTFSPLVQGLALLLIIISIREVIPVLAYIGLLMFILCYAIGFGGSTTAYITEILPPKGTSIALSFVWLFSAGQGKLLPLLATSVGDEALLGAFTIEYLDKRNMTAALNAMKSYIGSVALASVVEIVIAVSMVFLFAWQAFF